MQDIQANGRPRQHLKGDSAPEIQIPGESFRETSGRWASAPSAEPQALESRSDPEDPARERSGARSALGLSSSASAGRDLRLGLPKGRMQAGVEGLLRAAGLEPRLGERGYRPRIGLEGVVTKLLKPQNIVEMLDLGSRDVGFAGLDWVEELGAELVELVDTGLDPVRIVAAAPPELAADGAWRRRPGLIVASEYTRLTRRWIESQGLDARFLRTFGATEAFPPEDADLIVDNTQSGATLEANRLIEVDGLMRSTTRLYANPKSLEDPDKRSRIEELALLVRSVVEARARVMLELNVPEKALDAVCERLPCLDRPTVGRLVGEGGFAVKAAVPRSGLPSLIAALRALGGRDLVVSEFTQIVR